MTKKGLIIGKFYPLHRGHQYLIETALNSVNELTVLVCESRDFTIPAELRAQWLQQLYPNLTVHILDQDDFTVTDPHAWIIATLKLTTTPDIIFSSESYGELYAKLLGCRHISVDKARHVVPCSGSEIRANPLAHLHHLHPIVAEYFLTQSLPTAA